MSPFEVTAVTTGLVGGTQIADWDLYFVSVGAIMS